jgi:hypothetical protein
VALSAGVAAVGTYGLFAALCFGVVNMFLLIQMRVVHVYLQRAMLEAQADAEHGSAPDSEDVT